MLFGETALAFKRGELALTVQKNKIITIKADICKSTAVKLSSSKNSIESRRESKVIARSPLADWVT